MLHWILWAGIGLLGLCLLTLGLVIGVRYIQVRRDRRDRAVIRRWRPVILQYLESPQDPSLPGVPDSIRGFMELWNNFFESLGSNERTRLIQLVDDLELREPIRAMLGRSQKYLRFLAIKTLGHLQDTPSWNPIQEILESRSPLRVMLAMRALIEIDASKAVPRILDEIQKRDDFSLVHAVEILKTAGTEAVTSPLIERLETGSDRARQRLIPCLEAAARSDAHAWLRSALETSPHPEVLSRALNQLGQIGSPRDEEVILSFTNHDTWFVRLHAAKALGRIGTENSVDPLIDMLSDERWWIRLRAAQSLRELPSTDRELLSSIHDDLEDPYARDILLQQMDRMDRWES